MVQTQLRADVRNPYIGFDNKIAQIQNTGVDYIRYNYQD